MTVFDLRMDLPCTLPYARIARTVVAACGSLEDFSVDDLSDVRLLVDEVFTSMCGLGVGRVEMHVARSPGEIVVLMQSQGEVDAHHDDVDVGFAETLAGVLGRRVHFGLLEDRPTFEATLVRS